MYGIRMRLAMKPVHATMNHCTTTTCAAALSIHLDDLRWLSAPECDSCESCQKLPVPRQSGDLVK